MGRIIIDAFTTLANFHQFLCQNYFAEMAILTFLVVSAVAVFKRAKDIRERGPAKSDIGGTFGALIALIVVSFLWFLVVPVFIVLMSLLGVVLSYMKLTAWLGTREFKKRDFSRTARAFSNRVAEACRNGKSWARKRVCRIRHGRDYIPITPPPKDRVIDLNP